MVHKGELVEQTHLAIDFIQRLYLEISYLIKEIEAMLSDEEERFIIGKPGGYAISVRGSQGLESSNVNRWLYKKFAVFFVPEPGTGVKGGRNETKMRDDLKVLYLRFVLQDENVDEPTVYSGVLHSIQGKAKWMTKFEKLMGHFEYNDDKVFKNPKKIDYDDSNVALKGELVENALFEINNVEAIRKRIVEPALGLYRRR